MLVLVGGFWMTSDKRHHGRARSLCESLRVFDLKTGTRISVELKDSDSSTNEEEPVHVRHSLVALPQTTTDVLHLFLFGGGAQVLSFGACFNASRVVSLNRAKDDEDRVYLLLSSTEAPSVSSKTTGIV